jgi:transcriptional regulator with XRE-family HTH domain
MASVVSRRSPRFRIWHVADDSTRVATSELPLPILSPAASAVLDRAFQYAFGRLVAGRITDARLRLVEEHGDLYSQERVARLLGKSQTWVSNLEVGQRRIDTGALLVLGALYGASVESFVMPAKGRRENELMSRWMREFRALARSMERHDAKRGTRDAIAPSPDRASRVRR